MQVICSTVNEITLFCPLTGQDVLSENSPSPATIFIHDNEVGFVYLAPRYQQKVDSWLASDEELSHYDLLEKIQSLDSEDEVSCVCFSICETGPALEHVSVGFDMDTNVTES